MKRHILFSACFCSLFAGCIFSTRTPEPPNSSATFIWIPASTPDLLIQDLTGTLKILDATDYMRVFVSPTDSIGSGQSTFAFSPASDINQSSRGIFTDWSVSSEGAWVTSLSAQLPANSPITIQLTNPVIDQSTNSASVYYDYTISLPSSASSVIPGVVQGSLQFQLVFVTTTQGTKEWRISSWSDFLPKSGSGPTWSVLKVDLSS